MQKSINAKMNEYETAHKKRHSWKKLVMTLAAIVVFCTTYALILPAITMEKSILCDKPEHTHGESCYEEVVVPAGNVLICTQSHEHTAGCYTFAEEHTERVLRCTVEEHTHTDACYDAPAALDMSVCGMGEHTHGETCYENGSLVCTIPEHIHSDRCFTREEKTDLELLVARFAEYVPGDGIRENMLALAQLQLGFRPDEIGAGSPYDAWAGEDAADWNISFALYTAAAGGADINERYATVPALAQALTERGIFSDAANAQPGDLFFAGERIGILSGRNESGYLVIEGNVNGMVQTVSYPFDSADVLGAADSSALAKAPAKMNMMLAAVGAPAAATPAQSTVEQSSDNVRISKTISPMKEDGSYDLSLEAWELGAARTLDIALVMDVSGSMDDIFPETLPEPDFYLRVIYDSRTNRYSIDNDLYDWSTYYVYHDGELLTLKKSWPNAPWSIGLEEEGDSFFYTYNGDPVFERLPEGTVSKMDAVKDMAKKFVGDIAADAKKWNIPHQVSLVKFEESATTVCTYQNLLTESGYNNVISKINGLDADGNTKASAAMKAAHDLLYPEGGGEAKDYAKVVVFITDGEMTGGIFSSASDIKKEGNNTLSHANAVKTKGGFVYSLGVYTDNPSKDVRQFLYCVSSNNKENMITDYTKATKYATVGYYALATDSAAIAGIKQEIVDISIAISQRLNAKSVLHDALGTAFSHDGEGLKIVNKKLIPATGTGDEPAWDTEHAVDATSVTVTKDAEGSGFSITGFDYSADSNMVVKGEDGKWHGNKLCVTVSIRPNPLITWTTEPTTYDTNAPGSVYIYDPDDPTPPIATLDESPEVETKALTYEYEEDGEPTSDTVYVLPGTIIEIREAPDDEDFIDWKNGENTYAPGDPFVMPAEDTTFTAEYDRPVTYTFTLTKDVEGITTDKKFEFVVTAENGEITAAPEGCTTDESGRLHFLLGDDESAQLTVLEGTDLTVSEPSHNGYYAKIFDGSAYKNGDKQTFSGIDKNMEIKVINTAGASLPSTGGIGREAVYVIGFTLIAAAVIYGYEPRRKREGRNN